jgi:hypothetical protein
MVFTGYSLPFRVNYTRSALFSGEPAYVRITAGADIDVAGFDATMELFSNIAGLGALSGNTVPPQVTSFGETRRHSLSPGSVVYKVGCSRISEEAVVVLAHLLLARYPQHPLVSLEILASEEGLPETSLLSGPESTYPPAWGLVPFFIENAEPEGGGYSFNLEFDAPLEAAAAKQLNKLCQTWARTIACGGYALAPMHPSDSYVEVDEREVTLYEGHAEWAVFKLMADPDASLNGFLNALVAFHSRQQRISGLEIT